MSSAGTTGGVELDPQTIEGPAGDSDASLRERAPEESAGAPNTGDLPGWRRVLARVPLEVWILTALATLTRFVFLSNPRSIVFDEVYFREYSLHYKAGTYYFDLHPPLGKLLLGAWAAISGVDATALNKDPAVTMRILPALAGTALIIVVYYLIRNLSNSRRIATLGAGLLLLDNAILAESRFILMDSMLLLFGIGAVTMGVAARKRKGRAYLWWLAGAALLGGMAMTTKLTGISGLGLVGLLWLVDVIREKRNWRAIAGQAAILVLIPITVYVATFAVHFALLPKSGPGDAFMSQQFQETLKGDRIYNPNTKMGFIAKFKDLNHAMHTYELSLDSGTHPYSSKWWTWPIARRGLYLYYGDGGNGRGRYIYTTANPAVWWGTLLGIVVVLIGWIARPARFKPYKWALIFAAIGWAANYLPFMLITRPMFLYHYFYALIFSIAFMVIGLGALTGWIDESKSKPFSFPTRWSAIGYWSILGVALLAFLFFAPLTYGLPLTQSGLDARMWLSTWR